VGCPDFCFSFGRNRTRGLGKAVGKGFSRRQWRMKAETFPMSKGVRQANSETGRLLRIEARSGIPPLRHRNPKRPLRVLRISAIRNDGDLNPWTWKGRGERIR